MHKPQATNYVLRYSWPHRLVAPLTVVLGLTFPLLRHYVEMRQLERDDWALALMFVLAGAAAGFYFWRTVSVSQETIEFRSGFGRKSVLWNHVARIEMPAGKFLLISTSGERFSIDMQMTNGDLFARELDARFASDGSPRSI
jgi:hypothetical protein